MTTPPTPETNPFLHWMHRAETAEALAKRLAFDALVALAGSKICTPEEGYLKSPHCLPANIEELRKERDQALARVAVLRKALNEIYEDGNFISRFAIVARKALETEDQAASALLAERDALKAKLTVAEEALEFYAARRCERCAGITARNALDVIGAMP